MTFSDSNSEQINHEVENQRLQRSHELKQKYPELVAAAHTKEAIHRIENQDILDRLIVNPESLPIGTYGINAPTYRNAIESTLKKNNITKPRVLILGAETPGAVRQIINFTEK